MTVSPMAIDITASMAHAPIPRLSSLRCAKVSWTRQAGAPRLGQRSGRRCSGGDSVVLHLRATGIKRGPDSGATSVQRAWRAMLLPVLVAIPKAVPSMMFSLAG
jgi:hypothetical protein